MLIFCLDLTLQKSYFMYKSLKIFCQNFMNFNNFRGGQKLSNTEIENPALQIRTEYAGISFYPFSFLFVDCVGQVTFPIRISSTESLSSDDKISSRVGGTSQPKREPRNDSEAKKNGISKSSGTHVHRRRDRIGPVCEKLRTEKRKR